MLQIIANWLSLTNKMIYKEMIMMWNDLLIVKNA